MMSFMDFLIKLLYLVSKSETAAQTGFSPIINLHPIADKFSHLKKLKHCSFHCFIVPCHFSINHCTGCCFLCYVLF